MEELARDFADQAHFLFVYVREAHPGEHYPPHQYFEQKLLHATALRERGMTRPMVVDSLYGKVHRRYGGVSNMSWIIDHTGHVAYRASWTVEPDIRGSLEEILRTRDLKRGGGQNANYYREMIGLRPASERPDGGQHFLGGKVAEEQFRQAQAGRQSLNRSPLVRPGGGAPSGVPVP